MQKDDNVREQMFSMITSCHRQSLSKGEGYIPIKIQSSNTINTASAYAELVLADGKWFVVSSSCQQGFLKVLIS